jgi:hypothetical protein
MAPLRGRDEPAEAPAFPGVPGPGGVDEARGRGAVPVGVAEWSPAEAPQLAQYCAEAGTGWEQDGQGSVTGRMLRRIREVPGSLAILRPAPPGPRMVLSQSNRGGPGP